LQIVSGYQHTGIVQWASVLKIEGIDVLMLYERADKNLGREDAFKGDKLVFLNLRDLSLIFTYQPSFSGGDKRNVSKLWEFIRDSYGLYRAFQAGILDSSK